MNRVDARHSVAGKARQCGKAQPCQDRPTGRSGDSKNRTFHEYLAHQPARRRAQRSAHREFTLPRRVPREQQVDQIAARDDQHDQHRRK